MQKAGEAIAGGALSSDKKAADLKKEFRVPRPDAHLTSDFGVKQDSHDIWLSASTGDRKGPALLEDNHGREKACPDGL